MTECRKYVYRWQQCQQWARRWGGRLVTTKAGAKFSKRFGKQVENLELHI